LNINKKILTKGVKYCGLTKMYLPKTAVLYLLVHILIHNYFIDILTEIF